MTNNFSILLKKYSVPALFLIVGMVLLITGITSNQGTAFMMAAVLMLVSGILSLLYSSGKLKSSMLLLLGVLAGLGAFVTIYMSTTSVTNTLDEQRRDEYILQIAKQNLNDIRYVQKEHMKANGSYLRTWDEFLDFVKNGTVPFVISEGSVPARKISLEERKFLYNDNRPIDDNMTEEEAVLLSRWGSNPNAVDFKGFKRDTVPMDLMKAKFGTKSYKLSRERSGFYTFNADSLPIIPYTKTQWLLEVQDSIDVGAEYKISGLKVSGKLPYGKKTDMHFGSLNSGDLSGSWENE